MITKYEQQKCGIDRIGETISREVAGYTADIQMGVIHLVDTKADELKEAIKKAAPVGKRKNIAGRSK